MSRSKAANKVIEVWHSIGGAAIPVTTVDAEFKYTEETDWKKPMVFRVAPEAIFAETPLKKDVLALKARFQNSTERAHPGRANRRCSLAAEEYAQGFFEKLIPTDGRMDPAALKE